MEHLQRVTAGLSRLMGRIPQQESSSTGQTKKKPEVSLLLHLEWILVQLQEVSQWTDPARSALALVCVHVSFWLLSWWSYRSGPVSVAAWMALAAFIYTTWVQRVWPEIRVETVDGEVWTPLNPSCMTAPEISAAATRASSRLGALVSAAAKARTTRPASFCAATCVALAAVAYLGSLMSTLAMVYWAVMASLVLPGVIRVAKEASPQFAQKYDELKSKLISTDEVDAPVTASTKSFLSSEPVAVDQSVSTDQSVSADKPEERSYYNLLVDSGSACVSRLKSSMAATTTLTSAEDDMKEYLPEGEIDDEAEHEKEEQEEEEKASVNDLLQLAPAVESMPSLDEAVANLEDKEKEEDDRQDDFIPKMDGTELRADDEQDDVDEDEDDSHVPHDSRLTSSSSSSVSLAALPALQRRTSSDGEDSSMLASALREDEDASPRPSVSSNSDDFEIISDDELNAAEMRHYQQR